MISAANAPRFLYIVSFFQYMFFTIPVLMLYYAHKGVNMGDFFLLQGISWLAVFALEIPSGYISDIFSRKKTMIVGLSCWIIGYTYWIFNSGFYAMLFGELLFAVAISLCSGTTEAYLYDLLKRRKKEHQFHKKNAKMATFQNIGMTAGTLSGAFFYQFLGPESVCWISILALSIAIIVMAFLPDVPESRRKVAANKSKWQDIMDISKFAVKNHEIKWLIIFPAIYGALTLIIMWGLQSVMITTHVPVFLFGVFVSMNAFARTGWSAISGVLLDKFGLNKIIVFLCTIVTIAITAACIATYMPLPFVYVCLIVMITGSASIQLLRIASSTLVNHRIQSDERATVLSVKSMVSRLGGGLAMIGLKPLFDHVGVGETFMISALLLIPIFWSATHLFKIKLSTGGKHAAS